MIKEYAHRQVVGVRRHLIQESEKAVEGLLRLSQGAGVLNTAFIARLNATFRSRLALLVHRTRHRPKGRLSAGS